MVPRFCDVVVRYRDVVGFHGVYSGTFRGPLGFLTLLALFTRVCGCGCCCAWYLIWCRPECDPDTFGNCPKIKANFVVFVHLFQLFVCL